MLVLSIDCADGGRSGVDIGARGEKAASVVA